MSGVAEADLDRLRSALQQRAQALRGEIVGVASDRADALETAQDTVEDSGDEAERLRADEVRNAEESRDAGELDAVDAALARIDAGEYGNCVDCGCDIPLPRLLAQPAAARCVDCQQAVEQRERTVGG